MGGLIALSCIALLGGTVNSSWVAGAGMTLNAALVSGCRFGAAAVSVYPLAALSSRRFAKVATPFTERTCFVPRSESPLGLAPSDNVTRVSRSVTRPVESCTATCTGGLIGSPARALESDEENATRAGGAWGGGGVDPFKSLSMWQPRTTAASARTETRFISLQRDRDRLGGGSPGPVRVFHGDRDLEIGQQGDHIGVRGADRPLARHRAL